jgi:hypothetical protein
VVAFPPTMSTITKDFETFTENVEDPETDRDQEVDPVMDPETVFSIRQDRLGIRRTNPSNRPF